MKKIISAALSVSVIICAALPFSAYAAEGGSTETISYNYEYHPDDGYSPSEAYTRQMERLDRGLTAIKSGNGVYLSWRLFDSEDNRYGSAGANVSFNVYRNGVKITDEPITNRTNYTDTSAGESYAVAPVINGVEGEACEAVTVMNNSYFDIPLQKPDAVTLADGISYAYTANDASCGDVDGDGEYEIILKWDCNGKDNSHDGYTGNVIIDAYKLDGTLLWRVDLGQNIRAGAHYTQFLVYDFDGDGKAEMACKTSAGSKDSAGNYVSSVSLDPDINSLTDEDNEKNHIGGDGRPQHEPEFYTLFNGDGTAMDTVAYPFGRYDGGIWGYDSVGHLDLGYNRSERFLGAVAYLDGVHPAAVTIRGYYDRTTAAAYIVENNRLSLIADFNVASKETYSGQGNHNCTVADVDRDGKDEIIIGSLCWDDDLSVKWCSGRGHGDALHIGDYDPTLPGLEYFSVHESGGYKITSSTTASQGQTADFGMTVYRAETGEELLHQGNSKDTGRGVMANTGSGGYYQITGVGSYQSNGGTDFTSTNNGAGSNFRIFWDGDLYEELLDGTNISSWNGRQMVNVFSASGCHSNNGTKANPSLTADLFGDWREEAVYPLTDDSALRVFSTTTPSDYKIKTLMHDPVYRLGVAAEQTAYNQPPHVGFYVGEEVFKEKPVRITAVPVKDVLTQGQTLSAGALTVTAIYEDGSEELVSNYSVSGYDPNKLGKQTVTATYMGKSAAFDITVIMPSIEAINGLYETVSETSVENRIPIGSYSGAFRIEHTVTINSMPANGSNRKDDTNGFFVRFSADGHTGGGWYLTANNNRANVIWKNTRTSTVGTIDLGKTYTFRYDFAEVGTGAGAAVTLTILDENGGEIVSKAGLNLRNFSDTESGKMSPITAVQIYNQANSGSTASVTISDATLSYDTGITQTGEKSFNVTLGAKTNERSMAVAARYDGARLADVKIFDVGLGNQEFETSFEPDKVFLWDGMKPLDMWVKTN